MGSMTDRPRWWQLYLLGIAVIGLVIWAYTWHVSEAVHGTINIGIVLCAYGVLNLWLALNGAALEQENEEHQAKVAALTANQMAYRSATDHKKDIKKL